MHAAGKVTLQADAASDLDTEAAARPVAASGAGVRRRRVFYIGGFDPRSAGYYHGLYRDHGRRQAALAGAAFEVGPRRNQGKLLSRWTVTATYDGQTTETDYCFLRWDDLVRGRWKQSEARLLYEIWRCLSTFARNGVWSVLYRKGPATIVAGMFPAIVSTLYLAAMFGGTAALSLAGYHLANRLGAPGWVGALPPLLILTQLRAWWRWIDPRLGIGWLNRCFTYIMDNAEDASEAETRCDAFADIIVQQVEDEAIDEVLLVGHSQGTLHAIRTAARVLERDPAFGRGRSRFSLLTLGQPFAVYTPLPDDANFKRDLARVAASDALAWLDETSPGDPVSSCAVDPLNGILVEGRLWPVRKSPRFHLLLTKANFRRIKLKPLDFHFQYVMAGDVLGAYDYFRITAGPDFLLEAAGS